MANSNLNKAKVGKNDEFYTQMSDISRELYHYRQHFVGKKIFLNWVVASRGTETLNV